MTKTNTSPCTHTHDDYLKRSPQQCIWPPHPFLFPHRCCCCCCAADSLPVLIFEGRSKSEREGAREVCGRRSCKFFTSQELGQRLKWLRSLSVSPMQCNVCLSSPFSPVPRPEQGTCPSLHTQSTPDVTRGWALLWGDDMANAWYRDWQRAGNCNRKCSALLTHTLNLTGIFTSFASRHCCTKYMSAQQIRSYINSKCTTS